MVADKSKKLKVSEKGENAEEIDGELVLSIEKLQEIQDEIEKVSNFSLLFLFNFAIFYVFLDSSVVEFNLSHSVSLVNYILFIYLSF